MIVLCEQVHDVFGDVSTTSWHSDRGWAKRLGVTSTSPSATFNENEWYMSGPGTLTNPNRNSDGDPPFPVGAEGEGIVQGKTFNFFL